MRKFIFRILRSIKKALPLGGPMWPYPYFYRLQKPPWMFLSSSVIPHTTRTGGGGPVPNRTGSNILEATIYHLPMDKSGSTVGKILQRISKFFLRCGGNCVLCLNSFLRLKEEDVPLAEFLKEYQYPKWADTQICYYPWTQNYITSIIFTDLLSDHSQILQHIFWGWSMGYFIGTVMAIW